MAAASSAAAWLSAPSVDRNRFSGLMSRCTTSALCSALSVRSRGATTCSGAGGGGVGDGIEGYRSWWQREPRRQQPASKSANQLYSHPALGRPLPCCPESFGSRLALVHTQCSSVCCPALHCCVQRWYRSPPGAHSITMCM